MMTLFMKLLSLSGLLFLFTFASMAQDIRHDLPRNINPAGYYMFYFHGGVVTVKGDNAINDPVPQFGPYQYSRILDTLRAHGFYLISERRLPGVDDSVYVKKVALQVDTLLKAKVPVRNIILVGASAGSNIVLHVSDRLKNPEMKYVIMGGCSPDIYKYYLDIEVGGRFLSIIESSDSRGTCARIFENRKHLKDFHEITLDTGLDHGFIYKPYAAWIDPIVQWFQMYASGYHAQKATDVDGH
jgi:hypothetical protein